MAERNGEISQPVGNQVNAGDAENRITSDVTNNSILKHFAKRLEETGGTTPEEKSAYLRTKIEELKVGEGNSIQERLKRFGLKMQIIGVEGLPKGIKTSLYGLGAGLAVYAAHKGLIAYHGIEELIEDASNLTQIAAGTDKLFQGKWNLPDPNQFAQYKEAVANAWKITAQHSSETAGHATMALKASAGSAASFLATRLSGLVGIAGKGTELAARAVDGIKTIMQSQNKS